MNDHYFYVDDQLIIVDSDLAEWVGRYRWRAEQRGAARVGDRKLLHRLVMGVDDKRQRVLARNGDTYDCRRANLRIVSVSESNKGRYKPALLNKRGGPNGVRIRTVTCKFGGKKKPVTVHVAVADTYKNGRAHPKTFSIKKYGLREAVGMAIRTRVTYLEENNGVLSDVRDWNLWECDKLKEAFDQAVFNTK